MRALARLGVAWALLSSAASGCRGPGAPAASGPPPRVVESSAAPGRTRALGELPDDSWERARVAQLALTLELPDAAGWREAASPGWARLEHARSHSRVELNLARAERLVRPEDCQARARVEHPGLPRPAAGEALDQRRLAAPQGFLSDVTVSVNEAGGSELEGHVTAFGATVSRCFAFHFVTRIQGAGAENEIARRLGMVVERVLPSLALRAVDDRVSPEPFPRRSTR